MDAVSANLQTISKKIFNNAEKWLEKNTPIVKSN